jgi:hypothetical protein
VTRFEAVPRRARFDHRLPAGDQQFHRLQRASQQDGRRDHDAGRSLAADHQPGSGRQRQHLQELP